MTILVRADASDAIGVGHVMRCLALAQQLQSYSQKIFFVMDSASMRLQQKIESEGFEVILIQAVSGSSRDVAKTISIAKEKNASWIIVDGYQFDAEYQSAIKAENFKLLFMDDYGHALRYEADIILNSNFLVNLSWYKSRKSYTKLLTSTKYVLLRSEFKNKIDWSRKVDTHASKLLISFGGADPANYSMEIIRALKAADFLGWQIKLVVGPVNPHYSLLVEEAAHHIEVIKNIEKMSEALAWADMALLGSGSTTWEACFMQCPMIVLIMADNQRYLAQALAQKEVAINAGEYAEIELNFLLRQIKELMGNPNLREKMAHKGRELVDGRGCERVAEIMLAS